MTLNRLPAYPVPPPSRCVRIGPPGRTLPSGACALVFACLAALGLLAPAPPAQALELVREFRYGRERIELKPAGEFTRIDVRGGLPELRPGAPAFPRIVETVDLPAGTRVERVEVTGIDFEPLAQNARPQPAPEILKGEAPRAAAPDSAVYSRAGWQPEAPVELGYQGYERGRSRALLKVTPVRWDAASGRLERVSRIALRLVLVADPGRPLARDRAAGEWEETAPSAGAAARPAASAAIDVPRRAQPFKPTQLPSLLGSPVAYVIITNDEMTPYFQPLADWKTQCGLPAAIRTVSMIRQQYPSGVDDAERIRMFIKDAYTRWGTRWVLLGGDVDVIPERMTRTTAYGGETIPADAYYSCLDGTWNADGDSTWGEGYLNPSYPGDDADLLPEVWVGRAPVEIPDDVELFVAKTLTYEKFPLSDYMKNVLFFAEVLFPQNWPGGYTILDGAELIEYDVLPTMDLVPWMHVARMYENNTDARWRPGAIHETKAGVMDSLNQAYNIAVHVGHGYITVMSCGDNNLSNEDAFGLQNTGRPMNLYAIDCTSNAIDSQSLGEAFMRAPEGGAVTNIGSTRFDFPTFGRYYQQEYFQLLFQDSVTAIGEAQAKQKLPFVADAGYDNLNRWTIFTLLLLGDPDLRVFTNTPRVMVVGAPTSMLVSDSTIAVNVAIGGVPLYGARVTAWMAGRDYRTGTTDGAGNVVLPFRPDTLGTLTLTVTAFNAKPTQKLILVNASGLAALEEQTPIVVDDNLSGRHGNSNGVLDAGELVDIRVPVRNTGGASAAGVNGGLSTTDGLITIPTPGVSYGTIGAGVLANPSAGYRVNVPASCPDQREVPFKLDLITSNGKHWNQTFQLVVRAPELVPVSHLEAETGGNNNGHPEPGETVTYTFRVRNLGTGDTKGVYGRLRNYDGLATVLDSALTVPDLAAGAETTATAVRFVPSNAAAQLALLLYDANGLRTTQILDLGYPSPVTTLQAFCGSGQNHLAWAHSGAPDLAGYNVYRRVGPSGPFVKTTRVPSGRSSAYDDIGLAPLTRYDYEVAAVDSSGNESALTAPVSATTNPAAHAGYPVVIHHSTPSPVAVEHVYAGRPQELLVGADVLHLLHADGTAPVDADGFPGTPGDFTTQGDYYAGGGSIADLDGDGTKEIIGAAWNTQQLWVFDANGNPRAGFPANVRDQVWSSVAVGDLDGDGSKEMVFGSLNLVNGGLGQDLFAFRANGQEWMDGDSNPTTLGVFKIMGANFNFGTPALGDLLANGQQDIVYGGFDGKLYAWRPNGTDVPGFPVDLHASMTASAAIGRIDGPSSPPAIVIAAANDSLYVINTDGSRHAGFPVGVSTSGMNRSPSPALADMNGDGALDIVYASTTGWIHVFDHTGAALSPWLVSRFSSMFQYACEASPVVGDLNGDGLHDVVIGDEAGDLAALSGANGQMMPGFPIRLPAAATGSPAVCDCDGDGKSEIAVMDYGRSLWMFDYDLPFSPAGPPPWPQFHHDAARTGNAATPILLGVGDVAGVPRAVELAAPRPNPARGGAVEIAWGIPAADEGRPSEVAIFDLAGRRVRALARGPAHAGPRSLRWDLRDDRGTPARSGIYFLRLVVGERMLSRKLVVL